MFGAARGTRWAVLLALVLLLHGAAVWWLEDNLVGWGSAGQPMPQRMEVAFVRTLAPAEPAPVVAAAAPPAPAVPRPRRARAAAPAASAASSPKDNSPPVAVAEVPASAPVVIWCGGRQRGIGRRTSVRMAALDTPDLHPCR
jgi:hypothetical protein